MIKKLKTEHSAVIVIILTMVLLIFYYCANEVKLKQRSFDSKIRIVYEDFENETASDDLEKLITKRVNISNEDGGEKCEQLYEIARDMLRGERIKLPFETERTRWKFHQHGDLDVLNETSLRWNYPWSTNNSGSTLDFLNRYNKVKSRDVKVRTYFITFANNCCNNSKIKAVKSARNPGGFDFATVHDLNSLSQGFRRTHQFILRQKRGSGYWIWKPYVILKTLVENMANGDLLMYQDAGAYFIRNAGPLLKLCQDMEKGILVFHTRFLEKQFSKRDAFILMDMDDGRVYETFQRLASFLVVRRNCQSLQFVMEWLAYSSDPRILTDMDNQMGKGNLAGFAENRHDQTVLSLLSKKWDLLELRDPSQYGDIEGSYKFAAGPYSQLIMHSRDKS